MKLKSLQLENFRSYATRQIDFTSPVTAFVGDNAQGKTNILEAVAFLALGKSFRARKAIDCLKWETEYGRIRAQLAPDTELEVFLQANPAQKKLKLHRNVVSPAEFLGHLHVVLFTPDHLQLVGGSPRLRRQYMDRILIQLDRNYVMAFGLYQKILKQRNALLKRKQAQDWELDLWDARLVTEAQQLWKARHQLTDFLQEHLTELYQGIAGTKDQLIIQLHTHEDTEDRSFEERLMANRHRDLMTGSTSVGPHRDDFTLNLNEHLLSETGSRGECRSAVLALKVAQMKYMEQQTGEKPLLLLDDVYSELDAHRQIHLNTLIAEHQTLITTTSEEHIQNREGVEIIRVKQG